MKLFTSADVPFDHVSTNPAGRLILNRVPIGSYFITASKSGFLTPTRISVTVVNNRNTEVIITMSVDPDATKNAVFGSILDSGTSQPIGEATVELFKDISPDPILIGMVETNAQGQYLFANIDDGNYFTMATKQGYLPNQSATVPISGRTFAPIHVNLEVDPDANTGTISGIITDQTTGSPVPNAIVGLYAIQNGVETLIDLTKATTGGFYLFRDLSAGNYLVKSTVQVDI